MTISQRTILPSGRVVTLTYPPLYSILSAMGRLPTDHQVAVIDALRSEGSYTPPETMGDLELRRRMWLSNYVAASLCLSEPRLVLPPETPGPGEWGEQDITAADAEAIRLGFFRYYHQGDPAPLPDPEIAGGAAEPPPDGDGVRSRPRRTAGRERPVRGVGDTDALPVGGAEPIEGGAGDAAGEA